MFSSYGRSINGLLEKIQVVAGWALGFNCKPDCGTSGAFTSHAFSSPSAASLESSENGEDRCHDFHLAAGKMRLGDGQELVSTFFCLSRNSRFERAVFSERITELGKIGSRAGEMSTMG